MPTPPTYILRHRKERLSKCSLRGLEKRSDLLFWTYPQQLDDFARGLRGPVTLLSTGGSVLTTEDALRPLLLLDGTWRLAAQMEKALVLSIGRLCQMRALPPIWSTCYPRCQRHCPAPCRGLASVEALFAAHFTLHREIEDILESYRWKSAFLKKNSSALGQVAGELPRSRGALARLNFT